MLIVSSRKTTKNKNQSNVKDFFDNIREQITENLVEKAKALELDLDRYKTLEDTTDEELRDLQDANRALINTVERQRTEITNLKIEIGVLEERIPPHPDDFP